MLLNDWFWATLPDDSWTVTDDGQRIITDVALRGWLSGFDRYAILDESADNVTPETAGETVERESVDNDKLELVVAELGELSRQVAQLAGMIDGKAGANIDSEEVETW